MGVSAIAQRSLNSESRLPYLLESTSSETELLSFVSENRSKILDLLLASGALLFRGFAVDRVTFGKVIDRLGGSRLEYLYRSTPRDTLPDRVYTSTQYPNKMEIPLHCENAYQRDWPMQIAFFCEQPAAKGGETPLADVAHVTRRVGDDLLERFRRRRVRYVRNFRENIDLSWSDVFQTHSREEVERYCDGHDIQYAWGPGNALRTEQTCHGTAIHPLLGKELWFNQAHLFHVSSMGREAERVMLDLFGVDGLPRHACYGDGQAISIEDLELVRSAFKSEATAFPWQARDVLLVDNMQVAHGRRPYVGDRRVLVAMGCPHSSMTGGRATIARQSG